MSVRAAVIVAGYRCAAAVKNALARPAEDPFAIARWTVTRDVSAARIALVLAGQAIPVMSSFVYFDYQAGSINTAAAAAVILLLMILVFVVAYLLLVARRTEDVR